MTQLESPTESIRESWIEIDTAAIEHNAWVIAERVAPATLCGVVKADGYGHGAIAGAQAAIAGGASYLAVALIEEGRTLREAGVRCPILLLSEPRPQSLVRLVELGLTPTVYTAEAVAYLSHAVVTAGKSAYPVHVKVDTGMHRFGARPDEIGNIVALVKADANLVLEGVWTHFAVADSPEAPETDLQAKRFDEVLESFGGEAQYVHSANTAAAVLRPDQHRSLVRCGAAIFGITPGPDMTLPPELVPAMSVKSRVVYAKRVEAGEAISYGLRYVLNKPTTIATIPLGYADGVPRKMAASGEFLLGGKRRRIAGSITMDSLMLDCGDDDITPGDEVVLLGRQGAEAIYAEEWASRCETISYEIVCRFGPRLPRFLTSTSA